MVHFIAFIFSFMDIIHLESVDSTNNYIKRLVRKSASENLFVVAAQQTNGRGSGERTFLSEIGGLYLSFLMTVSTLPEDTIPITKSAAGAVFESLSSVYPKLEFKIKPRNDIYLNGKKLCGILTEMIGQKVIIGVGINVNNSSFPDAINATSLSIENKCTQDLSIVEQSVIASLSSLYRCWPDVSRYDEIYDANLI